MAALPGKIRRLRLKQKAKRRERVPDTIPTGVAEQMRLVDPALEKARTDGVEAAAEWVRGQSADNAAKSRALKELAILAGEHDKVTARKLVTEANHLNVGEARVAATRAFFAEQAEVHPNVSVSDIALAAREFGLDDERCVIGCVATLADDPNIMQLLEAFAVLHKQGKTTCLAVINGGPGLDELGDKAIELGIEDAVHFLGMPTHQRWSALLACCKIVVFPCAYSEPEGSEIALWLERVGDEAIVNREQVRVIEASEWDKMIRNCL